MLGAALLFSTGGAAIKLSSLTGWQIAGIRSGVAAVVLWLVMPAWREWWRPRALGVGLAYAATLILYVTANRLTTAANAIFLQTTAPIYLLLLGPWLLHERNRARDVGVLFLIGTGMMLFFAGHEPPLRTAPDPTAGNLVAALSGMTWALTVVGLRWLGRDPPPAEGDPIGAAVVAGNVIAFVVCAPFVLPLDAASAVDWVVLPYLGVVQIGLAYLLLVHGVRSLRALEVSLLLVLEPVLNAVWAWVVHSERPGPTSLAGCAFVLLGLVAQALRQRD